jgi:Uma2 family endonuclease
MLSDMLDHQRRPITVEEFGRMAEAGIFGDDERLELIDGELIVAPRMGPRHAGAIRRVNELLIERIGRRATVGCQIPLPLLPMSEPSPDFSIARFDAGHYSSRHPDPAEILWVIELGDATRSFDRNRKFPLYARYGLRETWLLDLVDQRLVVGRNPSEIGYGQILTLAPGVTIAPEALPEVVFAIDELLGLAV